MTTAGASGGQGGEHFLGGLGAAGAGANEDDFLGRQPAHAGQRWRGGARCSRCARGAACRGGLRQAVDVGLGGDADLVGDVVSELAQAIGHADLGLGDEIDRAQLQRLERDVGTALGQRRHHHHRHGAQTHQLGEEVDAIHARHLHVQGDDVGVEVADHLARDQGVGGRADAGHVGLAVDDLGEHAAHQGRVVYHHHSDLAHGVLLGQNRSMEPAPELGGTTFWAAARSCCTMASGLVAARRLTMALPLAGR